MGYSTSRDVLESRRDWLRDLELGRASRWRTTATHEAARDLAYRIREALYIASLYPDEYPALALARKTFSLYIVGPGVVEAKPRSAATAPTVHIPELDPTPVHGLGPAGRPLSTVGKTTANEIVEAWAAHAPSLDAIHFQQTTLPEEELRILYDWTVRHTPRLMMLVGDGFLTLSLRDAEVAPYAWTPPEPPAKPEGEYNL